MSADSLFFIYVSKNKEWKARYDEDWEYVSLMSRFFHRWIKKSFNLEIAVTADILPVITGKIFDRMSISYLTRDHISRNKSIYHFYLAYFKPFWTDCNTEGYSSGNFGMIHWERPKQSVNNLELVKFYADNNCVNISHILSHEILRMKGMNRKTYFDQVHDLWESHLYKDLPLQYYNNKFELISKNASYFFATIDIKKMTPIVT